MTSDPKGSAAESDDAGPTAGHALLGAEVYALIAAPAHHAEDADADASRARFEEVLPAHLDWVGDLEASGVLVLAGPLTSGPGTGPGSGIIVVRAASESDAEALAAQDPLVQAGLRTTAAYRWQINEGSLRLRVVLSRSTVEWG